MSDHTLTDHEWKLKMASEGKAFYIPGKTDGQVKVAQVQQAAHDTRLSSRSVSLTNAEWDALDTALPDVIELMQDVRNVCTAYAYADDLDSFHVRSVLRMTARAVASMDHKEVAVIDRLDSEIRTACKE